MATVVKLTVAARNPSGQTLFAVSFYSADVTSCEILKSAPTSGAIYITDVSIAYDGLGSVKVGSGKLISSIITVALEWIGTTDGLSYEEHFEHPIKLMDEKAMYVDSSFAGPVSGLIEGFVS